MSVEALNYARRVKVGNTTAKFVLTRLADRADERFSCFPAVDLIAAEIETGERTVQRALSLLRELRLVSDKAAYRPDGSQTTSRYYLHGPWDQFGGTGVPFPEIIEPKQARAELWASPPAEGEFRDGTAAAVAVKGDQAEAAAAAKRAADAVARTTAAKESQRARGRKAAAAKHPGSKRAGEGTDGTGKDVSAGDGGVTAMSSPPVTLVSPLPVTLVSPLPVTLMSPLESTVTTHSSNADALPDAVGQSLGGFARAAAREGAAGENDGGDGGCAASGRDSIPQQQDADTAPDARPARRSPRPAAVRTAPRQMPPGYDLVRAAVPVEVARPGTHLYVGLRRAVADLLTGNPAAGIPARTPEQVITRINRRWHEKGPERSARGYAPATTADADRPITSPQAWLAAAILGQDCTDPACEDGVLIGNGNGTPCTLCPERRADRSAARTGRALAEQHMTADLARLARETAAYEEVAADHERGLRAQHAQYGLTGDHLDQAVAADLTNWHDKHPKPTLTANRTTPTPAPRAARPAPAGDGRACIGWDAVPCGRRAVTTTGLCLACLAHADQQTATGAALRA